MFSQIFNDPLDRDPFEKPFALIIQRLGDGSHFLSHT